jgi:hypothetical protein
VSSSEARGDQSGLALRHGFAFGQCRGRRSFRVSYRLCSGFVIYITRAFRIRILYFINWIIKGLARFHLENNSSPVSLRLVGALSSLF